MPRSSAAEIGYEVDEAAQYTEENCSELHEINGIAEPSNPQCIPIMVDDMSTINDDPIDNIYAVDQEYGRTGQLIPNFKDTDDEDSIPEIQEGSNLAKYILLCAEKESPYGYADQNAISYIESDYSTGNSIADSAIGSVPIVGDIIDAASNEEVLANFGYVTGAACVTNYNSNGVTDNKGEYHPFNETATWEESRQYQRFIQNDRQAYIEGDIEESAVNKFLSRYYEEHPLDNSFEGIIARRSGLTKENVISVLNLLEVADFVANYQPKNLFPTPQPSNSGQKIYFDAAPANSNLTKVYFALIAKSSLYDKRSDYAYSI